MSDTLRSDARTERRRRPVRDCGQIASARPMGAFVCDARGKLLRFDPVFAQLLQIGFRPPARAPLGIGQVLGRAALDALSRNPAGSFIATDCNLPGRRTLLLRARRNPEGLRGWIEDVTAQRRSESQLRFAARHDPLTGLLNRRALHQKLPDVIAASERQPATVVFIDLDGFKQVNDVFGHAAGDSVLRQFATRVREITEPDHFAARAGGDEFVVVLGGLDRIGANAWVGLLERRISEQPFTHFEHEFAVRFSAGIAEISSDATPSAVLLAAERGCVRSKAGEAMPSQPASIDTPRSPTPHITLVRTGGGIYESLLHIQVQPIFSLTSELRAVGIEWLLRMRDEGGRIWLPAEFLPLMQQAGLASRVDLWVIARALEWLADRRNPLADIRTCTVKLSAAALHDQRFQRDAIAMLRNAPASAKRLRVELRGRHALQAPQSVPAFIDQARELGTCTVLSGFSDLPVWMPPLVRLRPAAIKLEAHLMTAQGDSVNTSPCSQALIDSCRALGIETCAARIEDAHALGIARACGFDRVQGFLFGRPRSLDRVSGLLGDTAHGDHEFARGLSSEVADPDPSYPDDSSHPPERTSTCPAFVSSTVQTASSP